MLTRKFGIEIEFTGITRSEAARIAAEHLGGTVTSAGDSYDTKKVTAPDALATRYPVQVVDEDVDPIDRRIGVQERACLIFGEPAARHRSKPFGAMSRGSSAAPRRD